MKLRTKLTVAISWAILSSIASATPEAQVIPRAFADAPDGYTPSKVDCPSPRPSVRIASAISRNETEWLASRRKKTVTPMRDFLQRVDIPGFDAGKWFDTHGGNASEVPNLALAFSGGGYRAMLTGGGALSAFDDRTVNASEKGHLGGLLQSATYVAGLSGGSWLVGSVFVNNFSSVAALQGETTGSLWELGNSIFQGPAKSGLSIVNTADYFGDIRDAVEGKSKAGFNTSVTDYWGRALSYQLVNATDGGPNITFSSIAKDPAFANGDIPMPILVADGRAPGQRLIPSNTTNFEFNPWEFGSYDPSLYGFAPLRYLGSNFVKGVVPDNGVCIEGYDNAGFVMGTSSTLFNQFLLELNTTGIPQKFKDIIGSVLEKFSKDELDIANYNPNPFRDFNNDTNRIRNASRATLVDGGEDLQNIPLNPLIQPYRHVDVILAVDSSADTDQAWPNGTSLVASYQRSLGPDTNGTSFPAIPDQNTFINLGLNTKPTFFGCNATNTTHETPLIVYLPNSPYVYHSNVSTFDPDYNNTERDAIVLNGYHVATMANATRDAQWPTCLACAVLSRSLDRTKTDVPDACQKCFREYCWNGTTDARPPKPYDPPFASTEVKVSAAWTLKSTLFLSSALTLVLLLS